MNNVDATVSKDEYGNLLKCVPPITLGEYEANAEAENKWYCELPEYIKRKRGDK